MYLCICVCVCLCICYASVKLCYLFKINQGLFVPDVESCSPQQLHSYSLSHHHTDNSRSPTTSEHCESTIERDQGLTKRSDFPCAMPALSAVQPLRSFYHNGVFKTYSEGLNREHYIEQRNRFTGMFTGHKQNVVVFKSSVASKLQDTQLPQTSEKETPVLKFSVNAILGSDHGKQQQFTGTCYLFSVRILYVLDYRL